MAGCKKSGRGQTMCFHASGSGCSLRIAPWLAVILTTVFFLVLFSRCNAGRCSCDSPTETGAQDTRDTQVVALMYHHLLPRAQVGRWAGNHIVTYVEEFERQLAWLSQNGWVCITPTDLTAYYENGVPLPEKAVLITFDDGYLSNAEYAAPLLRQYGGKATVFLVTSAIGEGVQTFSPSALQMMTRETLGANADVFCYAAHTHDLHKFVASGHSALTDADAETLSADIAAWKEQLRVLPNAELSSFSYPFGFETDAVRTALAAAGIHTAFRADIGHGETPCDPMNFPRCPVDWSVSFETFTAYFS